MINVFAFERLSNVHFSFTKMVKQRIVGFSLKTLDVFVQSVSRSWGYGLRVTNINPDWGTSVLNLSYSNVEAQFCLHIWQISTGPEKMR